MEDQYRAYWTACSIFVILAEWKHALRNAEPDAGRFLSSAKIKSSEIGTVSTFGGSERLTSFLKFVAAIVDVGQLQTLTDYLKSVATTLYFSSPEPPHDKYGWPSCVRVLEWRTRSPEKVREPSDLRVRLR